MTNFRKSFASISVSYVGMSGSESESVGYPAGHSGRKKVFVGQNGYRSIAASVIVIVPRFGMFIVTATSDSKSHDVAVAGVRQKYPAGHELFVELPSGQKSPKIVHW
jgi:hypothetical protein